MYSELCRLNIKYNVIYSFNLCPPCCAICQRKDGNPPFIPSLSLNDVLGKSLTFTVLK
jgi:hypothetical protein